MALEWGALAMAVAAESILLLFITVPWPHKLRSSIIGVSRSLLQPLMAIIPFAAFLLLDVYWKYEHRIQCRNNACTPMDREHFAKSVMKSHRNALLGVFAIMLYWFLYRVTHLLVELDQLRKRQELLKKSPSD